MAALYDSLVARQLKRLAHLIYSHPWFVSFPQVLLLAVSVIYTVHNLQFNSSRDDLVGAEKRYHQNYLRYKREFTGEDDLVVVVESEDKEKNRQYVERLGRRLEAETNIFTDVFYKGDLKMMGRKALLFLPQDTLGELEKTLKEYRPFIESFARATNLNSLFRLVNYQFRTAKREQNESNDSMVKAIPALTRILDQATASLSRPGTAVSPGVTALFDAEDEAEQQQYITFANGRIYLVSARPASEDSGRAVQRLRELVRSTEAEVPGANIGITGQPVLEFDEMLQSERDSMVATLVSLILCALIFIYGYRETGRPIKATVCLIFGLGYTMGYSTLAVGHLNILTVTFLPMLIGLAIDFGVHLITRYEEELRNGRGDREAMELAMVNTGTGIFTGCLTTAVAFLAMGLTNFKGIQEMGIITGGGMLICLIPMMTLLPVLLLRGRQKVLSHHAPAGLGRRARIEKLWLERPGLVAGITLGLCGLCVAQFPKVSFDYNLLNMQSRGLPAVVFEKKLIDSASKSVLFGAVVADSLEQAAALEQRITNLSSVASVDAMTPYLMGDQRPKLAEITKIKEEVQSIQFADPDPRPTDTSELSQTLFYTQGYLGLAAAETQKAGEKQLTAQLRSLRQAIGGLRQKLAEGNPSMIVPRLTAYEAALFKDIQETFDTLKNQDNSSGLGAEDLPPALRNRFIGKTGKYLLQVYPKANVWQRHNQEAFVQQLRTVDPNVTGTPVQLYEYTTLLKNSYETAAWYALAAIALMVLIHFRSLTSVVLALLPVGIGTVWMAGLMGVFGVPFNPANIMTLPLVIGIGVTNGIHILNRFAEEQNPSILAKSTGKAVLVSGLTAIAGFGSLIPAKHQGIQSLGIVMSIGVAACMLAALTFLPALLHLLMRFGWTIKKTQWRQCTIDTGSGGTEVKTSSTKSE
jgi:hopanoid biosynthesis associated RND transporter like protein HpnN